MKNENDVLKSKRAELVISLILIILLLIFILSSTFARYRSTKELNLTSDVARWNIKLNGHEISDTSVDFSTLITPVFPGSEHTAPNIIAPKAEGYFDIVLDYSEVDVAFTYNFAFNSTDSLVKDLLVYKYDIYDCDITDPVNSTQTPASSTTIPTADLSTTGTVTGEIPYDATATNKIKSVRLYVKWVDDGPAIMNNIDDTNTTIITDTTATHASNSLKVTAQFIQS